MQCFLYRNKNSTILDIFIASILCIIIAINIGTFNAVLSKQMLNEKKII